MISIPRVRRTEHCRETPVAELDAEEDEAGGVDDEGFWDAQERACLGRAYIVRHCLSEQVDFDFHGGVLLLDCADSCVVAFLVLPKKKAAEGGFLRYSDRLW